MYYVLIYGTLRAGEENYDILDDISGVQYIGDVVVSGYKMYTCGPSTFPISILSYFNDSDSIDFKNTITCELYEVTKEVLDKIDMAERTPALFAKVKEIVFYRNKRYDAYLYTVLNPTLVVQIKKLTEVSSGDWIEYQIENMDDWSTKDLKGV